MREVDRMAAIPTPEPDSNSAQAHSCPDLEAPAPLDLNPTYTHLSNSAHQLDPVDLVGIIYPYSLMQPHPHIPRQLVPPWFSDIPRGRPEGPCCSGWN